MKLNYTAKRVITTADLYDACDPPLAFEVKTRPPRGWALLFNTFENDGANDLEMAAELIAQVFISVSDGENTHKINGVETVNALRDAIEAGNPGYGGDFIISIAWAFGRNHYSYLEKNLGNSLKPLPQLNGSGKEKSQVKES